MSTYFRIQTADRDVADLLTAECQESRAWQNENIVQEGVSVCESREELAAYLAIGPGQGIPFGAGEWVVVEVEGDMLPTRSLDEEYGERLVRPTRIVSVKPMDDDFFALIDACFEED